MKKLDLNALRVVSGGRCAPFVPPVAPPAPTHGHFGGGGGGSLLSVNARVS